MATMYCRTVLSAQRRVAAMTALLLLVACTAPLPVVAGPRIGGGGVSRPPAFSAFGSRPPPAPFAAAPPPAFGAFGGAGAAGAAGGAWRGYSRPGFRTSSLVLPFAAGALAGGALATLTANPNAYCNGGSLACYRNTCQGALSRCPETNATTVVATSCPDPRFTECWQSPDGAFQCFGRRRPRFGNEDIEAYCSAPEVTQLGPMRSGALAAQAAAAPVRVAAAAVAVLIGAGALAL